MKFSKFNFENKRELINILMEKGRCYNALYTFDILENGKIYKVGYKGHIIAIIPMGVYKGMMFINVAELKEQNGFSILDTLAIPQVPLDTQYLKFQSTGFYKDQVIANIINAIEGYFSKFVNVYE